MERFTKSATERQVLSKVAVMAAALVLTQVSDAASAEAQVNRLGFPVGEKSKLHTNLSVATAYDANPRRREDDRTTPDIDEGEGVDDVRILIRPSIELDVPGQNGAFRLRLGSTISQFLGTGSSAGSETRFGLDANLYLRIGSQRSAVAFIIENSPILTPTVMDELGTIGSDEVLFPALSNVGKAYLTLRPGGGALEFDIGYKNNYVIYLRDQTVDAPDDGFFHNAFIESRLKFLPKTALVFYGDFGWFDPSNPEQGGPQSTLESNPFSVMVGLIGQITRKLSAEVRVGYAETLAWQRGRGRFSVTSPSNQRTVVGLASVTWDVLRTARVTLSYQRSLQPTIALTSFITDAIRLRGNWNIDRLVLGLYAEAQFRDFGTQETSPSADVAEPTASLVFGGARADYYFLDWLVGGLNYRLMIQDSNDSSRGFAVPALGSFERHQVIAQVGVRY